MAYGSGPYGSGPYAGTILGTLPFSDIEQLVAAGVRIDAVIETTGANAFQLGQISGDQGNGAGLSSLAMPTTGGELSRIVGP